LIGLFSILISIPLDSCIFEKGKKQDALSTSTWANTSYMFFNMIFFGILAVIVNVFEVSFILAATSMFVVVMVIYLIGGVFFKYRKKSACLAK